jgi:hypothetical protein
MAGLDLRPLSLGEILDRTFSLYRRNFLLFLGITAIPNLLVLGMNLAETFLTDLPALPGHGTVQQLQTRNGSGLMAFGLGGLFVGIIILLVAYLFAQGGTVYAVSELYLGRTTTITASLGRMKGKLFRLFFVTLFNGLAIGGAFIFLIIPGIYVACRLITCVPAALLEDLGPVDSLNRSFSLTKDNAGRSFVIFFLYCILLYGAILLLMFPFLMMAGLSVKDPSAMRMWMALAQVGNVVAAVLVGPFLTIAAAVFYFDLRVRKEAFDLQVMMNPSGAFSAGTADVPRALS